MDPADKHVEGLRNGGGMTSQVQPVTVAMQAVARDLRNGASLKWGFQCSAKLRFSGRRSRWVRSKIMRRLLDEEYIYECGKKHHTYEYRLTSKGSEL